MFLAYFRKTFLILVGVILLVANFLIVNPARALTPSANIPGAPILTTISTNSIKIVIDQNGNDSTVKYAIYNQTLGEYVNSNGNLQPTEDWQSYANWGGLGGILNIGLIAGTNYIYQVKAENSDSLGTAFSAPATATTLNPFIGFSTPVMSKSISSDKVDLEIVLSEASGSNISVEYAVIGGTAVKGIDYDFVNGTVNLGPRQTFIGVELIIYNNHLIGSNKTIIFSLSNPQNADFSINKTLTFIIVNDNKAPAGSFKIDSGANVTNNRDLSLSLIYQNATQVLISLDPNFIGATYQNVAKTINFTLPDADGKYTIYLKYKDQYGNESQVYSQTITLDRLSPVAPFLAITRQGSQIILSWNEVEVGAKYEIYRDGILIITTDSLMFVDENLVRGQNYTYYVIAVDSANNESAPSNSVMIYLPNPQISSVSFESSTSSVSIASTSPQISSLTPPQEQAKNPGTVQAATTNANQVATNWALIIAIILAGLLILGGGLYWWYSREEDEI